VEVAAVASSQTFMTQAESSIYALRFYYDSDICKYCTESLKLGCLNEIIVLYKKNGRIVNKTFF